MGSDHPILENDAILEAVFEIRFGYVESTLPEFFVSDIAKNPDWKGFKQGKLPVSDIPESLRRKDANLRHKPIIELLSPDGRIAIHSGPDVLIVSRRGDYPGWDAVFGQEIAQASEYLFRVLPDIQISRLGLRYVNALRLNHHGVSGIDDLQVAISVADKKISEGFNLNFRSDVGSDVEALTRLSTLDFASGTIPEDTKFVLDIDVHTGRDFATNELSAVVDWSKKARIAKNVCFFSILGKKLTEKLKAK